MSTPLREGVQRLEVTLRVTLGVLALASGVYTFLGARNLLNGDPTTVFYAAVIYSVAVSVGIYAFWMFLMRIMPHVRDIHSRGLLFGCMVLGSLMIIAMSAWLNASALAGAAAVQQHLANTLEGYTRDLSKAYSNGLAAQSLLPDIKMGSERFAKLAESERSGSLTGTGGSGTVVQLLTQMSGQLAGLSQEVTQSAERMKALFDQGGQHLEKMRELVSDRGLINERSDAFGKESMALLGTIASLQQMSIAPAVKRTAEGLASSFIAPASGARGDLGERQAAMVDKVQAAVTAQSAALSAAADKILALPAVQPARFRPMSQAEAVVLYAADFAPSWAGAISIDLLPAVLVLILCVVHASLRREGQPISTINTMTASELITALRLAREVDDAHEATRPRTADDLPDVPQAARPRAANDLPDVPQPMRPRVAADLLDMPRATLPRAAKLADVPGKQPSVPPKDLDQMVRAELERLLGRSLKEKSPGLIPENTLPPETLRDLNGSARTQLRVARSD
jgi:hypothetical protein